MPSLNDKGKFKKKMFFIDFIEHVFSYIAYKQEWGGGGKMNVMILKLL